MCTCIAITVPLLGYDWTIRSVCSDPVHQADGWRGVSGDSPPSFGIADYVLCEIGIARRVSMALEISCLKHELGHVLAWSTSRDANSEELANINAQWLSEASIAVTEYVSRTFGAPRPNRADVRRRPDSTATVDADLRDVAAAAARTAVTEHILGRADVKLEGGNQ